jgi:hypothetical protein
VCVTALDALALRIVAREVVHVSDRGEDGMGRFSGAWLWSATYRVRGRLDGDGERELEMVGTPKLRMARYLPKS